MVGLTARIEKSIDGTILAYRGMTRFSTEGFEDVRAVMGEAIPGPGPCSIYTRRMLLGL